jgi:hypothetical protein
MLPRQGATLWWETEACRTMFSADIRNVPPVFDPASGMLIPTLDAARVVRRKLVRHVTWEDTLPISSVKLNPADRRLLNQSFSSCLSAFCMHVGVPLAVGTHIRPVRAFVDVHNRSRFTVPIEKVASSSLRLEYGYRHLKQCAHQDAVALFSHMSNTTACGYAGSFLWDPMKRLVSTAFVRHPFRRFLTSLVDHGRLRCSNPRCSLLINAKTLIDSFVRKKVGMKLFPPASTIHMYTQSYFLSATNMVGRPIRWTRINRIEETPPTAFVKNKKSSYVHILEYLVSNKDLRCSICHVYRQDFVCLGYTGCEDCGHV